MSTIVKRQNSNAFPGKKIVLDGALPPLALQHIWFEMQKHGDWKSIALVPMSGSSHILWLAHGLGLMAVREPHDLIWVVNASSDCNDDTVTQEFMRDNSEQSAFPYKFVNLNELGINKEKQLVTAERMLEKFCRHQQDLKGRVIFAVDSILDTTHAIPLCRSVDNIILCISLEHTKMSDVRRTMEIIGPEKIVGSIIIKPKTA